MASVTRVSPPPEIEYPDSDGKPMSDHTLQYKWIVVIREGLADQFADDPNIFVGANLLWYPVEGKPTIRGALDVLVAIGRPQGERGSYKQWQEGGIVPQAVFEVLSPGNRPGEMKRKFQFYERHGVEEYYVYDPFSGSLEGWRRRGGELKKIARMRGFVSPRLGFGLSPAKARTISPSSAAMASRSPRPWRCPGDASRPSAAQRPSTRTQRPSASAPRGTPRSSESWESSRIEPTFTGSIRPRPPSRLWPGGRA